MVGRNQCVSVLTADMISIAATMGAVASPGVDSPQEASTADPSAAAPLTAIHPYDDVRGADLRNLNLSADPTLPPTLTYNPLTQWPTPDKLPAGFDPAQVLEAGKNPGLGVRAVHARGITGAGINVAIVDQPMFTDHPEYDGKVVAYHDVGRGNQASMHGPAVASLLVGTSCGTAPRARL